MYSFVVFLLWQKTNLTIFKRNCFTLVLRILITIIPDAVLNRQRNIYVKEADYCLKKKQTELCVCLQGSRLLCLTNYTFVYKEADCFLTIHLLFCICFTDHNAVLFFVNGQKVEDFFFLLLPECPSLTSFFLKWQQQKTKVFQSHVWIFSILLLQSPPVPLLELTAPIPGGDLIRKSSHFPTNIDGIYQYRSFS